MNHKQNLCANIECCLMCVFKCMCVCSKRAGYFQVIKTEAIAEKYIYAFILKFADTLESLNVFFIQFISVSKQQNIICQTN